jgi:hypothetical protein
MSPSVRLVKRLQSVAEFESSDFGVWKTWAFSVPLRNKTGALRSRESGDQNKSENESYWENDPRHKHKLFDFSCYGFTFFVLKVRSSRLWMLLHHILCHLGRIKRRLRLVRRTFSTPVAEVLLVHLAQKNNIKWIRYYLFVYDVSNYVV